MTDTSQPLRPWDEGVSILDAVRAWKLEDDPRQALVDERWEQRPFFGAGGFEGMTSRRSFGTGSADSAERARSVADHLADLFGELAESPSDDDLAALYLGLLEARESYSLGLLDRVVDGVVERDDRAALAEPMRKLVTVARHRVQMKFALAVLGVSGGPADVPQIMAVGRHPEFSLFAVVAILRLVPAGEAVDPLWTLAKSTCGWGRTEAVWRLATIVQDRPDVQRWLLLEGCKTTPVFEQPAKACATAGDLAGALAGPVDDELLEGAHRLIDAFLEIGPPQYDLVHYRDGAVAVERFLEHQPHPAEVPFDTCGLIWKLERWTDDARRDLRHSAADEETGKDERRAELAAAGWTDAACDRITRSCAAILDEPSLVDRVRTRYAQPDQHLRWLAWTMAPRVGLDLWDAGFRQLTEEGSRRGLLQQLVSGASVERRRLVITWAENNLPLRDGDPDPVPARGGRGQPPSVADDLAGVVRGMRDGELFSEPLILALLRTPQPVDALAALADHPRERWGRAITTEVEQWTASPKKRLAEAARRALDR